MASDSEHTNRPSSPQQAQGRKWPIVVLLLGVVTLALALTACGGSSSTSAPGATTGSPATPTSTPESTLTPEPTEVTRFGESAGISRETQEYLEAHCALLAAEQEPTTWGEMADLSQKSIDWIEKNKPPDEVRGVFEFLVAWHQTIIKFAEERRSLSVDSDEAWTELESEEGVKEAYDTLAREQEVLDDAMVEALQC